MTESTKSLADRLMAYKRALKLTYSDIAERSGIPASTVKKVLTGQTKNPRRYTLADIEKVLSDGAVSVDGLSSKDELTVTTQLGPDEKCDTYVQGLGLVEAMPPSADLADRLEAYSRRIAALEQEVKSQKRDISKLKKQMKKLKN